MQRCLLRLDGVGQKRLIRSERLISKDQASCIVEAIEAAPGYEPGELQLYCNCEVAYIRDGKQAPW